MNFTVSTSTLAGGQQWLSATPSAGRPRALDLPAVTVTVNQAGLSPGFYYGLVRVDSAGAANTPQVATIALQRAGRGSGPWSADRAQRYRLHGGSGRAAARCSMNLFVYNISATPQTYVSRIEAPDPNDKFKSFIPQNATLSLARPTRLVVQPLTSGLAAGVYDAMLTLQFSDGNVRRVGIRTIVTPAPLPRVLLWPDLLATGPGIQHGCTPSQLVPVITTLGQSFGVPAAWPVALETAVLDDCGNTLDNGSVKVSFSNGDPPLSLQPEDRVVRGTPPGCREIPPGRLR